MRHNKTGLFLMELIVAVLFFSLASAICIQMFVKSHTINARSSAKSSAIRLASNIAEVYQANKLKTYYPDVLAKNLYYDASWQTCSSSQATYQVACKQKKQVLTITISQGKEIIYTLSVKHYQQITF